MPSRTLKITGVPEELVSLLDAHIKTRHAAGRSEYVRELIRKDVLGEPKSFRELLAPVHAETVRRGTTEEEIDALVEKVRTEIYVERHKPSA